MQWNPIFDEGFRAENLNRDINVSINSSMRSFLINHSESIPEARRVSRPKEFFHVWPGIFPSIFTTSATYKAPANLPNTSGRNFITNNNFSTKQAHAASLVDDKKYPVSFLMVSGELQIPLWVSNSTRWFFTRAVSMLQWLVDTLNIQMVIYPAKFIFFGHGYVQHVDDAHHE